MKKRYVWIDLLRIIAMFSVILMHVMGNTLYTYNLDGSPRVLYYALIDFLNFSVPLFIMISGIIFLDSKKEITLEVMLKKYCLKIIYIILLFGAFNVILEEVFINKSLTLNIFKIIFIRIITGDLWSHMWYLYLILGIYLITPFLKTMINHTNKRDLSILLIMLFIFLLIVPEINHIFNIGIVAILPATSTFVFYYLYAYYIKTNHPSKTFIAISYLLSIIAIIFIILKYTNNIVIFNTSYESLSTFFITNSILLMFLDRNIKIKGKQIINNIGENSLGIYVLHQFYINIIFKLLKFDMILTHPYTGLIIYSFMIFTITYLTTAILRKFKIFRKIL